jgi:hypothetical protein
MLLRRIVSCTAAHSHTAQTRDTLEAREIVPPPGAQPADDSMRFQKSHCSRITTMADAERHSAANEVARAWQGVDT